MITKRGMLVSMAMVGALMGVSAGAVGAAPAPVGPAAPACASIGNGDLCISSTGHAGVQGTISVSYHKHQGSVVHIRLGWESLSIRQPHMWNKPPELVFRGGWTGYTWTTWLGPGCVRPLVGVQGGGHETILPGNVKICF